MNRNYEVFERMPYGAAVWRAFVPGLEKVRLKLQELGELSANEFYAVHMHTREVVARVNIPS
jgi:hypothetical protein